MKIANGNSTGGSLSILVVEDCETLLTPLARYLRSLGHQVTTAPRLKEARVLLEQAVFDLLLVDLDLPDGNGCSLLQQIPPGTFGVSCSGFTEVPLERCEQWLAHLRKPYNEHELKTVIWLTLQRRGTESSGCH